MKKLVSILIAVMLLLTASALAEGQTYTVGVCQLVTHDALDAATQGFMDALTEERDTLAMELSQAQKALDDAAARSQAASARADELEEQLDALMEESAQTALAYEQRAQEDAQTIETLAAQAESLAQASAGGGAPSAAPALTPPPAPTVRPLYTIPLP